MPATEESQLPSEPILRLEPGMHGAKVNRIDVDAAGRFLVTGAQDKTVRVWSLDDGQLLKTLRVPLGEGDVGRVEGVAIEPDGARIAAGGWGPGEGLSNSIYIFERASGRIVARVDRLPSVIRHLTFSPDGHRLVATLGDFGIRVFETGAFRQVAEDRDYGSDSYWAAFDRAGRLVTSSYDGKIRLYDSDFRLMPSKKAPGGKRPFGVAFSPDGARVAVGYDDNTRVDVLDGQTLAPLFAADTGGVDNGDLSKVAWSADGWYLYAAGRWGKAGKCSVRRWPDRGRGAYEDIPLSQNNVMDLRPLADGRLAFGAADPSRGVLGPDGQIVWRQDSTQADFRDQEDKLAISRDGSRVTFGFAYGGKEPATFDLLARRLSLDPEPESDLAIAHTHAPRLEIKDWEDGYTPTLNGKRLPLDQYERSRSLAIAPDGGRFLLGTEWSLRLFDRQGQQLWRKPVPGIAWAVNVSGDGRLAVAAFADGTIRWFQLADGAELLAFFPHQDRQRWVVWTPKGYYMASPGGEELIGWHVNRGPDTPEFYSAGRFRDRFHRPDVVALVLEELDVDKALARANREAEITPAPAPPLEDILPPLIQILDPTVGALIEKDPVAISWRVWAPGGEPISAIRVMINGTLAMTFADPNPADPIYLPVIGRARAGQAIISLIAESARGASDPASIGLQIAAAAAAKAPPPPRLFVLAVGVGRYKHKPPQDLKYAARDAEDVATYFLNQKGRLYREVSVQALMDTEATRAAVTGAILGLFDQVNAGDVVMIFFSGHGVVERDVYYYLAHDANSKTQVNLRMTAIDEHELTDCFKTLFDRQAKVYAFFDTCYAGALGDGSKAVPTDMERFASKLASEENGVVVFTSCTAQERSNERDEWQNGAFTEALLEALNGKAARPGERDILLSDVERYLKARVPELTGRAQTPKIYIPFKEFIDPPIAVVPK